MKDHEEACASGHRVAKCKYRPLRRTVWEPVWETVDTYELLDGLEQFPELKAALIDCLYRDGMLTTLPEGVTVRTP